MPITTLTEKCVEVLVGVTLELYHVHMSREELWKRIRVLWGYFTSHLSFTISFRAGQLLSQSLLQHCFLHRNSRCIARLMLVYLAARVREVIFRSEPHEFWKLCDDQELSAFIARDDWYPFTTLDLTGIDLTTHGRLLQTLLPRCPKLLKLTVSGTVTFEMLEAARLCPLTHLYLTEPVFTSYTAGMFSDTSKAITQRHLLKWLVGTEYDPSVTPLQTIISNHYLHPTWPNLVDVKIKCCQVTRNTAVLALIALKKLQHLDIIGVDIVRIYLKYCTLMNTFQLPSLSLKMFGSLALLPLTRLRIPCQVDAIYLCPYLHFLEVYDELIDYFASIRTPIDSCYMQHDFQDDPLRFRCPRFQSISSNLRVVVLQSLGAEECVRKDWLSSLLKMCPLLRELDICDYFDFVCDHEDDVEDVQLNSVISLIYSSSMTMSGPYMCLFNMFPNLRILTLDTKVRDANALLEDLRQLERLRILKIFKKTLLKIEKLCKIPRTVPGDDAPWELHAPYCMVSKAGVARLRTCGWWFLPIDAGVPSPPYPAILNSL